MLLLYYFLTVDDIETRLSVLYAATAKVIDCSVGWSSLLYLYCADTCLGVVVEIEGQEASACRYF